jgi:hypothetical protein
MNSCISTPRFDYPGAPAPLERVYVAIRSADELPDSSSGVNLEASLPVHTVASDDSIVVAPVTFAFNDTAVPDIALLGRSQSAGAAITAPVPHKPSPSVQPRPASPGPDRAQSSPGMSNTRIEIEQPAVDVLPAVLTPVPDSLPPLPPVGRRRGSLGPTPSPPATGLTAQQQRYLPEASPTHGAEVASDRSRASALSPSVALSALSINDSTLSPEPSARPKAPVSPTVLDAIEWARARGSTGDTIGVFFRAPPPRSKAPTV